MDLNHPKEDADYALINAVERCGEIYMRTPRQNELFVFLCTLCDKKFNTFIKYANHFEDEHLVGYTDEKRGQENLVSETYEINATEAKKDIQTIREDTTSDVSQNKKDRHFLDGLIATINDQNCSDDEYENVQFIETDENESSYDILKFASVQEPASHINSPNCLINPENKGTTSDKKAKLNCNVTREFHQCSKCGKTFKRKSNLKTHELSHQLVKPFPCSECNATFANKQNLVIHVRRHTGEKPFKCSFCEKTFVSSSECNAHLRSHTGERPFICEYCGKGNTTSSQLLEHRKQHTDERRYLCIECQKSFRTSAHLFNHINALHSNLPRSFGCNQCNASFKTSLMLYQHSKIHSMEKRYKCRLCCKAFAQHPGLYAHVKTHEKNYIRVHSPKS